MNKERVLQAIDNLKGSLDTMDYGRWGALNVEQRNFIRALCSSWLILDEATNKQTKEIERLNNIINELEKYTDEDDWTSVNGEIAIRLIKLKLQELKGSDK